jgi:hypothetical protein
MKLRKLRIAWSVGWGVLGLLAVAGWIRCLFVDDFGDGIPALVGTVRLSRSSAVSLSTLNGGYCVITNSRFAGSRNNLQLMFPHFIANNPKVMIPFSLITFVMVGLGSLPWLSVRFSLRTLLLAMTLLAVGLGWIVYSARH